MAALPRSRSPERTGVLTASAFRVPGNGRSPEAEFNKRSGQEWQKQALGYYSEIGEVRYGCSFYSRMMKRLRIYPATLGTDEQPTPITEGPPVDLLNRVRDPGGGRSNILGEYGKLMFATGEGYLFGRDLDTVNETWSFVWSGELDFSDDRRIVWRPAGSIQYEYEKDVEAVAYRMWTPHPAQSYEADSPMMSVLKICNELVLLTDSVAATATSRLARNGALLIPTELSPSPVDPGEDEDPEMNPVLKDIIDHVTATLQNPGSAASTVPIILEGMAEFLKEVRWVEFRNPQSDYAEQSLRTEAIKRLALGFDMPPEELLGMANANHWTAWQIQDSTWQSHGAPIAEQFCTDLNQAYLRPALRELGYAQWNDVVIKYDAAEVVVNPDRSDDANEAFDREAIGYVGYRKMKNIPDDLAPTDEEVKKMRERNASKTGPNPNAQAEPDARDVPEDGPDAVRDRRNGQPAAAASAIARELGAADLALLRCRELAGNRLRQKQRLCPDCFSAATEAPAAMVANTIGADALPRLGISNVMDLTANGADGLRTMLQAWGYSFAQAAAFSEMVEVYAARTLFSSEHPALPASFASHLESLKEAA